MNFLPNRNHHNPVNRFAENGCRSLAPSNYEIEPVIEETSEYSDEESNDEIEINDECDESYENHQQSEIEEVGHEQPYLTWRKKNSHLFCPNKSQQASNIVIPKKLALASSEENDNLTLLNRINEISRRLEQDNTDSDCNAYNKHLGKVGCQYTVGGNNKEVGTCEKNIQMAGDLNESGDYDRIKELYSKVFPSEKGKLPRKKGMLHDNGVYENQMDSFNSIVPYNHDNFEGENADVTNQHTPKKMVSFERKNRKQNKKLQRNEFITDVQNSSPNMHSRLNYSDSPNLGNVSCRNTGIKDYSCQNEQGLSRDHGYKKLKNRYDNDDISTQRRFSNLTPGVRQNRSGKSRDSYYPKNQYCCPQDHHNISMRCNESQYVQDISDCSSSTEGPLNDNKCSHKKYKSRKRKITLDELYKIVKLQNEQITLLQKQIDRLLEQGYSKSPKARGKEVSESMCNCCKSDAGKMSTQGITLSLVKGNTSKIQHQRQSETNNIDSSNVKQSATNVSIGVMTSFVEITQKMQSLTTRQCNGVSNGFMNEKCDQNSSGLQTSNKQNVETGAKRSTCPAVAEESFTLNEVDLPVLPPVVDEHVPTPQCSLHLDIQDYGSTTTPTSGSSDGDSEYQSEDNGDTRQRNIPGQERVGWTLYDNVVGQINKILQTNGNNPSNNDTPKTSDVRTATIQQLKKLGVSFVDNEMPAVSAQGMSEQHVNNYHTPTHNSSGAKVGHVSDPVSPMQYLNEDEILQAAINIMAKRKNGESPPVNSTPIAVTSTNANTDLSFATMKYMERYQLLPGSNNRETNIVDGQLQQGSEVQGKSRRNKRHSNRDNFRQQYSDQQQPQRQYNAGDHQWPQHQLQYVDQRPQNFLSNKILDITALKQQPKLL